MLACCGESCPCFSGKSGRGPASLSSLQRPPTIRTLNFAPLLGINRSGQSIVQTRPTGAVGGAKDEQTDDCRHLVEGYHGDAYRRGSRRTHIARRGRHRSCSSAGRSGSAPVDRNDQPAIGLAQYQVARPASFDVGRSWCNIRSSTTVRHSRRAWNVC